MYFGTVYADYQPDSGRERAKYHKDALKAQLETMFDFVELRQTEKAGDATAWAKKPPLTDSTPYFPWAATAR